ncbi:hypothetical protein SAMN05428946_2568 [Edaphobacillus lindanitolerans]|uniref:Uncharacterized protein n=1 Tax=Edaphobacillus lindanitolerans TaxID=550447 RepID=A0A1U7PSG3_9BACI|nr:hypothetical protein SAMN05428946_2568 [Edaphobacillus lindanitolerans]
MSYLKSRITNYLSMLFGIAFIFSWAPFLIERPTFLSGICLALLGFLVGEFIYYLLTRRKELATD